MHKVCEIIKVIDDNTYPVESRQVGNSYSREVDNFLRDQGTVRGLAE